MKLRKYLVKCAVEGGVHIKTFNSLTEARRYAKNYDYVYKTGIPHIYKLIE